nr:unnamed protein product [Digitaria exilis]
MGSAGGAGAGAAGSSASSPLLAPRAQTSPAVGAEVRRQVGLAAPLVACSLLQYSLQVVSVMFAGHLGELSLSGASVAASFANVTGFSVLNPEISTEAGLYAQWLIPGLFAYGLLQCLTRFLQSQNIVHILVVCSGLTLLLHVMLCWFLVQVFGLGHKGAALATSISYWFNVALLAIYVKVSEAGRRSWNGWSREALESKDVMVYLRLAIPSTFMTCLEYWAFEMVVLLAGFLPDPKLETSILSISLNTMWMVYTIPSGLSSAIRSEENRRGISSLPFFLIGGKGLWLGIICAMAVQIFALVMMMLRTSWDEEVHP